MEYKFNYKKKWFWKSVKVIGHSLNKELNRMDLYLPDGSLISLSNWNQYDFNLGVDWVLSTKNRMEKESGQPVQLNVQSK